MSRKYILLILLFGFLVYSNTLKNPYLWDDGLFIQNGNFIKRFENCWVFFSPKNYFKYTQDFTYRPLPFLLHIVNYKIWNTKPVGHRITNVILHIANAVLVYFLVLYLLKNNFAAFLSGLFFVVHPVNTEVVNMVSFVETQLSTLFFLLAFLLYVYLSSRQLIADYYYYYRFSVLCFFLAVFCKETAITLPAIIILYDLILPRKHLFYHGSTKTRNLDFFRNFVSSWSKKYVPFFAVAVFYLVVRFFIFRHPTEATIKYPGNSFITNIKAILVYLSVVFSPFNLSVEHNIKVPTTFLEPRVIFGFSVVIIFLVISIYVYKKSTFLRPHFFWLLWIPITFLPTSNIIPMQNIVAERYLYLPLIGICVFVAVLLDKIGRRQLIAVYGMAGCIVILLAAMTVIRNRDWKDDWTFYLKTLKQNPDSPGANINIAMMYAKKKDFNKAIEHINTALKMDPDYVDGQATLASIYQDFGYFDKALEIYQKTVSEKKYTYHKAPFFNLGVIYKIKKQYTNAIKNFNKAIELNPLSSISYSHLAEIYETQGDIIKAKNYFEKSADINPDDYIAFNSIGIIYIQKGMHNRALKYLKKALKLKPDSVEINFNIGYIYFLTYRYGEALRMLEKTLQLNPNYERAKYLISQIEGTER
ncbi:MAG: tetratricopeptide repeat protein [Elusimicrobiota bacterium]